jgi:hypothetical protein
MRIITAGIADIRSFRRAARRWPRASKSRTIVSRSNSFDHLVGAGEDRWRHREAEFFRGLEIDDKFEFCGLLNGEVSRFGAIQDLATYVAARR